MTEHIYNTAAFTDNLGRVIEASRTFGVYRACLLTTRDRSHALNILQAAAAACRFPLYHFTVAGRHRYDPERLSWQAEGGLENSPPELLRQAQELKQGGMVVLEDCLQFLQDDQGDSRMRMTLANMLSQAGGGPGVVLVFLEPPTAANHMPSMLADQFIRLDIPYPRLPELEAIAKAEMAACLARTQRSVDLPRILQESCRLATCLVGLTHSAARDALRDTLAPDALDFQGAFALLQSRKAEQLRRELAMNVLDTTHVEEPIGLDYLVDYLLMAQAKMRLTGPARAKGILLIGPPGTGKTMLARTIGHLVKLPVVEFRIAALMNSYLGETEQRFARAFATLEAMSPNIVFIDELEKAFGDSSERDGGTMMRVTGSLLSWLSDNPYPNFIIGTSNSLARMGEIGQTMTRSERFDAAFFVDVPGQAARRRMLARWLQEKMADFEDVAATLAQITEKFSGADLYSVVKTAAAWAEYHQQNLTVERLQGEVAAKRPRVLALYDQFQDLRRWGSVNCQPAGPRD